MSWNYPEDTPSFVAPDGKFVLTPTPSSYALPPDVDIIPPNLVRCLAGDWPPEECKSEFHGNHNVTSVPNYGLFHGGIGNNNNDEGAPSMGPTLNYAWNYPMEYMVSDHGFRIPMTSSTVDGVPSRGQSSSSTWEKASSYWVPSHGFVIPPMAHQIPSDIPRGVPPMSQTMIYSWNDVAQYEVPDHAFVVPDRHFEVPYGGVSMSDFNNGVHDNDLRVHKTPSNANGVHGFKNQPMSTEKVEQQQEPRKPKLPTSTYGGKKRDVATLLEGFTVIEEVRRGGKSIGHKDKYYIHIETEKKLRSLEEVERFKLTGNPKKPKPIANETTSNVAHLAQPLQQLVQLPTQEVASSSAGEGT